MKVIFFNGRPKSGIHLLTIAEMYGKNCFPPNRDGWVYLLEEERRERFFKNDIFFVGGHYRWTLKSEQLLRSIKCKMVLIIRDLRDCITAGYRALEIRHKTSGGSYWQQVFDSYNGNQEKIIEDMILDNLGTGGTSPKNFKIGYLPWMEADFCYVTKFEKLIGSRGGGDNSIQLEEFQRICEFIELPQTDEWYQIQALKLYDPKITSFISGGGVGSYKKYFSKKNIKLFEKVAGKLHRKMGYK